MEARLAERRAQYKSHPSADDDRRAALLARQRAARAAASQQTRALLAAAAAAEEDEPGDSVGVDSEASLGGSNDGDSSMADAPSASPVVPVPPTPPLPWGARAPRRIAGPHMRSVARFAKMIQLPEWLTAVPSDLCSGGSDSSDDGWLVLPRPEGRHCLVIASNGVTVARDSNGVLLTRFQSDLPGGSASAAPADRRHATVLDCVWAEGGSGAFFAQDILVWRGAPAVEGSYDFRHFWLQSKLAETRVGEVHALPSAGAVGRAPPAAGGAARMDDDSAPPAPSPPAAALAVPRGTPLNDFPFLVLPAHACDRAGIVAAYRHAFPPGVRQDGLLFCCKASQYVAGSTPLALRWRDAACSPYFSDDAASATGSGAPLTVVLEIRADGSLVTAEGVALGAVPAPAAEAMGALPGDLLRFGAAGATEGPPGAAATTPQLLGGPSGVSFLGLAGGLRAHADSWSRILVQARARRLDPHGGLPVSVDALLDAASRTMMM